MPKQTDLRGKVEMASAVDDKADDGNGVTTVTAEAARSTGNNEAEPAVRVSVTESNPTRKLSVHRKGLRSLARHLSFSKHRLPSHKHEKLSNLSQSIAKVRQLRTTDNSPEESQTTGESGETSPLQALPSQLVPMVEKLHISHGAKPPVLHVDTAGTPGKNSATPGTPATSRATISSTPANSTNSSTPASSTTTTAPPYNAGDAVATEMAIEEEQNVEEKLRKEEDPENYRVGGYHPTFIGERYGLSGRYIALRKLGWGHFSTVWLAWDTADRRHVAIKIVRASKDYREAAEEEIRILDRVKKGPADHPGRNHVVQLLDHFVHRGPNGEHICMVFEVLGENIVSLVTRYREFEKKKTAEFKRRETGGSTPNPSPADSLEFHLSKLNDLAILHESYGGLPLTLARQISKQILLGLDYLHRECGIIHTDLKPENVLVEIHDVEGLVRMLERERRVQKLRQQQRKEHPQRHRVRPSEPPADTAASGTLTPRTPVHISRPLTAPVEMSSSVEKFFRSFSVSSGVAGGMGPTNSSGNLHRWSSQASHTSYTSHASRARQNSITPVVPTLRMGSVFHMSPGPPRKNSGSQSETDTDDNHVGTAVATGGSTGDTDSGGDVGEIFVDAREDPSPGKGSRNNSHLSDGVPVSASVPLPMQNNSRLYKPSSVTTRSFDRRGSVISTVSSNSILNDLDSIITVKIADLGNACWYDLHYTNDIETRQYRAPEVILGGKWGCSTDMWSCACMIFELITGDYLFDPKCGATYDKNDDHLAQMIELLQSWPRKEYLKRCKYSRKFFDKSFQALRHIGKLRIWTMKEVLMEEYHIEKPLAQSISDFLLAMLEFEPKKRVDAGSMTNHPWLNGVMTNESIDRPYGLRGQDIRGYSSECRHQ